MIDFELLKSYAAEYGVELDETALERFDGYAQILSEKSKVMNLTAIKEADDIVIKHFADSLSLLSFVSLEKGAKMLDVGTGAGFPGTSVLTARPDLKVTMLDSTKKKLDFIKEALDKIGLKAELVHSRAEEAGQDKKYREKFDLVTARAVANLRELCEYCLPFVKVGGTFAAMKGAITEEELSEAEYAIGLLGGEIEKVNRFNLKDAGERTVIIIKKISQTPTKYPRPSAKIAKQPLDNSRKTK